jgi:hypothetical protein
VTRPSWTIRLLDRSSGSASPLQSKPLTSAQLRAARSLIRWSTEDLARETALSIAIRRRDYASANGWVDQHDQPDHPRMGKLLLSLPCQKALQSAGSLDNPKALVASHQAMAKYRLEGISHEKAAHGVQAGQPCRTNTNTLASDRESPFIKAGCGKTACPVCVADGGEPFNRRLLRPDSNEASEQSSLGCSGARGAK